MVKIKKRKSWVDFRYTLPLLLAVASVLIRSYSLNWGLPDLSEEALPMKKAFEMNSWGLGNVQFNPETAGWPSFSFYLHMFVQQVQFYLGQLMGDYSNQGDFFLQKVTWSPLAVWARAVGVIAAAIIVGVGTRLGYRLAGFSGGILSGLILLSSPLLTRFTHLITPDILVFLFAGLALYSLINIVDRGSRMDYLLAGFFT